jgi:hypothetical protein
MHIYIYIYIYIYTYTNKTRLDIIRVLCSSFSVWMYGVPTGYVLILFSALQFSDAMLTCVERSVTYEHIHSQ